MTKLLQCVFVLLLMSLFTSQAIAQNRTISGKITDTDGSPLPGVSVTVKGSTKGAATDINGAYKVNAQSGATITFSMVGMQSQTVKVDNQSTIDVILKSDENALSEVVVTALGIKQEKKALGYSVQDIKGQDIVESQRDNFLNALQGRVAGATVTTTSGSPGASTSIVLRGANSIGGNNSPLFVVDGLPVNNNTFGQDKLFTGQPNRTNDYMNRIADINPNDIESVTVLKGGTAAALYGIDAAGGAIVIETKKGGEGRAKVTYENRFGSSQYYRFPEIQTVYGRGTQGQTDPNALSAFGPKYEGGQTFFNNIKNFFQTGTNQRHNLSVEGGSKASSYRFSTSYTDENGIVPNTGKQTLNLRLTGRINVSPKLEVISTIGYTDNNIQKAIQGPTGTLFNLLLWPVNDDARNYLNADGTRRLITGNGLVGENDNPFFSVNKNKNFDKNQHTSGNVQLLFKPLSWLKIRGNFGADIDASQGTQFLHPESYFNNGSANGGGALSGGSVENYSGDFRQLNGNIYAIIDKKFGKISNNLLIGTAVEDRNDETFSTYGEKLYLPDFNSINNADPTTMRNKYTLIRRRVQSVLGSYTLNYDDMVYLTVTGRNDWSSTLPIANRSFFYPSFSGAFNFTELPAFRENSNKILSFGKIRASYAEVGRDADPYKVLSSLVPQTTTGGGFGYGFYGGNPNLKPERKQEFEIGTELKFFKNRIGLDISYYNSTLKDQIVSQRLSYGTGFIFGLLNGGTFTTKGLEITLNATPIRQKDFNWTMFLNFSKFKTSVKDLPANVAEYYNSDTWAYANARASAFVPNLQDYYPGVNLSYNQNGAGSALAIGGYSYLRNNNGSILISPATGLPVINSNFLPIGDRTPDFTLGFTNQLKYKSFNLSFLLDFRKGGDVFNGTAMYMWRNGLSMATLNRETPAVFNGVLRDGKENTATPTTNTIQITPNYRSDTYYSGVAESDFVEHNINWMRLKDVTLSYELPKSLLSKTKFIQRMSIFTNATDLFMLTNYTGADPNVNGTTSVSGGAGAGGFDVGKVSVPRSYSFGLRVGF